jgi:hypothetical protein
MTRSTDDSVARRIGLIPLPRVARLEEQRLMPSMRAGQVTVTIGVEAMEQLVRPLQEWAENLRRQFESLAAAMGLSTEQFLQLIQAMEREEQRHRRMQSRDFHFHQDALPVFYGIPDEPGIDAYSGPVSVDINECWREDCDEPVSRDDDVGLCDDCKAELKEM